MTLRSTVRDALAFATLQGTPVTFAAVNAALVRLIDLGIVGREGHGQSNRLFRADDVIKLFEAARVRTPTDDLARLE